MPSFVHAPYLVNLGSPSADTLEKSVATVRHCLLRGPRSAPGASWCTPARRSPSTATTPCASCASISCRSSRRSPRTAPTCCWSRWPGRARCSARPFRTSGPTWPPSTGTRRPGVCLDTCHAFAAGHDLPTPERRRRRPSTRCTPRRPGTAQAGPCQRLQGRRAAPSKDRHENIGAGHIGDAALRRHDAPPGGRGGAARASRRRAARTTHREDIETAEEAPRRLKRGSPDRMAGRGPPSGGSAHRCRATTVGPDSPAAAPSSVVRRLSSTDCPLTWAGRSAGETGRPSSRSGRPRVAGSRSGPWASTGVPSHRRSVGPTPRSGTQQPGD